MSSNNTMVDKCAMVLVTNPQDMTGTGFTGNVVSLKNHEHVTFIIMVGSYAGGTPAITLTQGTSVSMGTSKSFTNYDYNWRSAANSNVLTRADVTSGTFNLAADDDGKIIVIEIDASQLDVQNGYDCIRLDCATPGSNADLIAVLAILSGSRYQTPASVIID